MKTIFLILISTIAYSQTFISVKTPEMYWVIGSVDSSSVSEIARSESEYIYAECNGVRKIIFCGSCGATYTYNGKWMFSMPIGTEKPKSQVIKLGAISSDGIKQEEDSYDIGKIYKTKHKNPLSLIFSLDNEQP